MPNYPDLINLLISKAFSWTVNNERIFL